MNSPTKRLGSPPGDWPANKVRTTVCSCGGHIEFHEISVGAVISCPHCHAAITLKPEKTMPKTQYCPYCGIPATFDFGTVKDLTCPHCKNVVNEKDPSPMSAAEEAVGKMEVAGPILFILSVIMLIYWMEWFDTTGHTDTYNVGLLNRQLCHVVYWSAGAIIGAIMWIMTRVARLNAAFTYGTALQARRFRRPNDQLD
jgi:DNA-directed RNA polymerase subunit RPC12/RpoP